jgi:hypothetical protein
MKNMVKQIGIAALVLAMAFGMMVVGCDDRTTNGKGE